MAARGGKVLVLHWDEHVLMAMQRLLEDSGYDTTITWDSAEALQLLGQHPFEFFVVTDHPPRISAEGLLRHLADRGISVRPVVVPRDGNFQDTYLRIPA